MGADSSADSVIVIQKLYSLFYKRNEKCFSVLHLVTVICVHITSMLIYFRFNQRILMGADHLWC